MSNRPFSRREEMQLIRQAQAGCAESRNRLLAAHEGFIRSNSCKMFRRYKRTHPRMTIDEQDAYHEAVLGFVHAINKFDTERGNVLLTYAFRGIHTYVYRAVIKSHVVVIHPSSNPTADSQKRRIRAMHVRSTEELEVENWHGDSERECSVEDFELVNRVYAAIGKRATEILRMRFERGMKLREISEVLGVSKQAISQAIAKAYRTARMVLS